MPLVDLVFSFGENVYEDGSSSAIHQYLSILIGAVISGIIAGIIAFKAAKWQISNQKNADIEKEQNRLKEERLQWFYSLYHLFDGINSQVHKLEKTIRKIKDDLANPIAIANYERAAIVPDILPSILHNINSQDIFKIFVLNKNDEKTNRKKLFASFYSGLNYLIETYSLMKMEQQKAGKRADDQHSKFDEEINALFKIYQDIFYLAMQGGLELPQNRGFKDEFINGLLEIFQTYKDKEDGTVEMAAMSFAKKTITICASSNFASRNEAGVLRPIAQTALHRYDRIIEDKRTLSNFYEQVSKELKRFNDKILEAILQIEFSKEYWDYKKERDVEKIQEKEDNM